MFYSTQIKSVGYGGAYDISGKWLTFIGYLPVKVGDTVYTDGNVIFGNVPPKGSAMNFFFKKENGIPVLGADLRGFFSLDGVYKSYSIVGVNWLANSEKYYAHDNGEENIIDAEISLNFDGEADGVFSAEKIVQLNADFPSDDLFSQLPTAFFLSYDDCDFCNYDDAILKDCKIIQRKDNQTLEKIAIADIAETYETDVSQIADALIPQNQATEDHLQSRAKLLNFKLKTNGQWEALILVDVCNIRFRSETLSVTALKFESDSAHSNNTIILDQQSTDLSGMGLPANLLARIGDMSTFLGGAYAVDVISDHYYVTVVDDDGEAWNNTALVFPHRSFLLKLTSENQNTETLAMINYRAYSNAPYIADEGYFTFSRPWDRASQSISGNIVNSYTYVTETKQKHINSFQDDLPYIRGFLSPEEYNAVSSNRYYNTWTYVDSANSKRIYIELVSDAYGGDSYTVATRSRMGLIDVVNDYNFTRYTIIRIIRTDYFTHRLNVDYTKRTVEAIDSFTFHAQDNYKLKIYQSRSSFMECIDAEILNGDDVIFSQSQLPDLADNAYESNISICPLNAGYLVGVHGKHLYTIINNAVTEVDDELKNFRLRELKPISKSKV